MKYMLNLLSVCSIILFWSSFSYANYEDKNIPDIVFYKFIKQHNKDIPYQKAINLISIVKYYTPRYFGVKDKYNEGMVWYFSILALESAFRNVNGDEGRSIGYSQIQVASCDIARNYNGISRQLNLIDMRHNIWCGYAELNRLYELTDGDWNKTVKAYNGGFNSVKFPNKYIKSNKITDEYFKKVTKNKRQLELIILKYFSTAN